MTTPEVGKELRLKSVAGAPDMVYSWPLTVGKGSVKKGEDEHDQAVEILDTILEDDQSEFYRIQTARDIIMNTDGSVHFNTFYLNRNNRK